MTYAKLPARGPFPSRRHFDDFSLPVTTFDEGTSEEAVLRVYEDLNCGSENLTRQQVRLCSSLRQALSRPCLPGSRQQQRVAASNWLPCVPCGAIAGSAGRPGLWLVPPCLCFLAGCCQLASPCRECARVRASPWLQVRRAVYAGPYIDLLHRLSCNPAFRALLGGKGPDASERDQELILRFFALWQVGPRMFKGGAPHPPPVLGRCADACCHQAVHSPRGAAALLCRQAELCTRPSHLSTRTSQIWPLFRPCMQAAWSAF